MIKNNQRTFSFLNKSNLELSEKIDSPLFDHVIKKINFNTPTVLFGASTGGKEIYAKLVDQKIKVDYFCDNNKELWGNLFCDVPVLSPIELKGLSDPDVLISSSFQTEIFSQLAELGLHKIYHFPLIDIISEKHYDNKYHIKNKKYLINTFNILDDDKSKTVFLNLIKYRLEKNLNYIKDIRTSDMYIPPRIINRLKIDSIVFDIGAYNGDTIEKFLKINNISKIHAFEPEHHNFRKIQKLYSTSKKVISRNLIISNKIGSLFISNEGAESKVSTKRQKGFRRINSNTIDEYCNEKDVVPNYIKMDVEGFEKQILKGGHITIKNHKPILAVSVYHMASDLWKVPTLIKELNSKYKMQLCHHSYNICDSVLYCY